MSDISVLKTPNNQTFNLKDVNAIGALSFSGHTLTVTKRNLTATEIDLGDFDSLSITDLNTGNIVNTGDARFLNAISGDILGNAATATKATQDESGNNIKASYASSISISDHTITLKNKNGTALGTVSVPDNNTTYTFSGGTNKFTVTPLGGTAQDVTITPSIANNITGQGTNGYLAKFNGTNTLTSGPSFDSNDSSKYLRHDGTWVTPPDTKALGSMTGTLGVDHGGTGKNTAKEASSVFLSALDSENTAPIDTTYYISQDVSGGANSTTYVKKPMSALWSYTNTKISNVLGLTATDYGGNAATATQLENSVNISVGNKTNSFDGSTAISFPTDEIGMKRSDLVPIQTATYTGLIGGNTTTNDSVNNSFYFMKLRPDEFSSQWKVCYRIKCYVPNNTSYCATAVVELYGIGQANAPIFHIFNQIYSTSYRPAYYHNYYRLSSAGYNNGCYNAIGIGFRNSKEQATANLTRTIYVELLETHQCTVEFLPDAIKWGSWENNATTNYTGLSEFDFYTNGLCETNDANSNTYDRRYLGSTRIMAGENKIFPYSLVMQLPNGTWESLTTTGGAETNKVVNPHGFLPGDIYLFYYNATIAAGTITTNNYLYETHAASDMKYSFNCGTTLTANKSIYIVGTITNGLFHVASEMYSLALPTTADGKYYMYLGETINTYQITMAALHPIYYFDGHLRQYSNDDPYIITGGTNKITIQSRGSQTSKDVTFTASDPTKLPLTGGTLTGDLYGTNAVFSGDVTVGGNVAVGTINGHTVATNVPAMLDNMVNNFGYTNDYAEYFSNISTEEIDGQGVTSTETSDDLIVNCKKIQIEKSVVDNTNVTTTTKRGKLQSNTLNLFSEISGSNGTTYTSTAELNSSSFHITTMDMANGLLYTTHFGSDYIGIQRTDYPTQGNGAESRITLTAIYENGESLQSKYLGIGAATSGYNSISVNGNTNVWLRVPQPGLIPYTEDSTNGDGSLGTTGWPFKAAHIKALTTGNIEMQPRTNTENNGGWIDFHYNKSTADYTTRIIEPASGILRVVNTTRGNLQFYDYSGTNRAPTATYGTDGRRLASTGTNASGVQFLGQWGTSGTTYSERTIAASSSDIRLKKNIEDANVCALDVINQIRMRQFDWKESGDHWDCGMVVDEMEKDIDPKFCIGGESEDGISSYKSVNTFYLQGYEVKAIQELSKENEDLKKKIQSLEERLEKMGM